jgi:hypothetical protein
VGSAPALARVGASRYLLDYSFKTIYGNQNAQEE